MRKTAFIVLFLFILVCPVFAVSLENYDVLVDIRDDHVRERRTFEFANVQNKFDLFVFSPVSDLKVEGASGKELDCLVERQTLGDLIVCENFQEKGLTMEFDMHGLVEKRKNFRIFSYMYVLTRPTERFHLKLKLPVGSVFVDEESLQGTGLKPYKPLGGIQGTDGRKIYIEWTLDDPPLGQNLDAQVIFEPSVELSPSVMAITIVAIIVMLGIFFYMSRRGTDVESVMQVLSKDEKKVVNVLKKQGERTQKQIAREADFSTPKVSRLVSDLEKRGIVEKRSVGRSNKIKLKESFGREEERDEKEDMSEKFYKKE